MVCFWILSAGRFVVTVGFWCRGMVWLFGVLWLFRLGLVGVWFRCWWVLGDGLVWYMFLY